METNAPPAPPAPPVPSEPADAGLLLEWEASLFLFGTEELSRGTVRLRNWRSKEIGPPYVVLGGLIRYRRADLLAWLDSQTIRPGSKPSARKARPPRRKAAPVNVAMGRPRDAAKRKAAKVAK